MKKQFGLLLLFVFFGLGSNLVFSRGGSNPTVTVIPTITHATCFNPNGIVEYEVVVTSEWENEAHLNMLDLYNAIPESIYTNQDENLLGTITNVGVGVYTISGSISALNSDGMWVGIPFNMTIWVGIETVWAEFIDMIADPNSFSAKRDGNTQSYGGARSSNGIDSGDGWVEMKAQYGTTTDNRVFWLIGENNLLGTFSPGSNQQYIEFYKGSSGNGIKIKYEVSPGVFGSASLSTNENDKIRLVKTGSILTVQKNNSISTIFALPLAYSGSMNIVVRSLAQNDGCLDVISTFSCRQGLAQVSHAELKKRMDGGRTLAVEGKLKFTFDEEYDVAPSLFLSYNIYDENRVIKGQSDDQGNVMSGSTALTYQYDDNRYTLDVSGMNLTQNRYYTLEVLDSKGGKKYLKFIYKY